MLIEIETGIKLSLPRKQIFQACFMLEGPAQLGAVISQGLLLMLDFMLFVCGAPFETANHPFKALTKAYPVGTQVASDLPTSGASNKYSRRSY